MTLIPECPCCMGLMVNRPNSKLSSACSCGYPAKVSWDQFPQLTECKPDPLKHLEPKKRVA